MFSSAFMFVYQQVCAQTTQPILQNLVERWNMGRRKVIRFWWSSGSRYIRGWELRCGLGAGQVNMGQMSGSNNTSVSRGFIRLGAILVYHVFSKRCSNLSIFRRNLSLLYFNATTCKQLNTLFNLWTFLVFCAFFSLESLSSYSLDLFFLGCCVFAGQYQCK